MLVPEAAVAPVIAPVFVPNVHAKELATLAVRLIAVVDPLQTDALVAVVTDGIGFTVTVQVPVETVAVVLHNPSFAYLR